VVGHPRFEDPTVSIEHLEVHTNGAAMYAPLEPLMKRVHLYRRRPRRHRAQDVLVPQGFAAEVVATGFYEPVHCCFDDRGACYVMS
jgi:hypothetical protein